MNHEEPLQTALSDTFDALGDVLEQRRDQPHTYEVGVVTQIGQGIAKVRGLPNVRLDELLKFPGDLLGMAFSLGTHEIGVILLGESEHVASGDEVHRTQRVMDVPVGTELLGRVVDATGQPLDDRGRLVTWKRYPVERPAPPIMHRAPVTVPLQTGIKSVDALVPVGRGQRELIMGDRHTGKTTIALDTIINQRDTDVICIYCAIGQRSSSTAKVIDDLREYGATPYSVVVVASGNDPPGLQFLAPYAATSIGEHFMTDGRDVLVVYDDLSSHANAYRELSLLLRRPPGREAYPGDVFYIHSRLLERSTHLRSEHGGGSLTALPIVETEAQNISAYIPTNLISITDGQIYLSPDLFHKGMLPAVDVGQSVSRVGGRTQLPAYRAVAADLRLAYSQFQELEVFARFGAQLDEETQRKLEHGRRVRQTLKQPQHEPRPVEEQIAVLSAVSSGVFDDIPASDVERAARTVASGVTRELPDICQRIRQGEKLTEQDLEQMQTVARRYVYIIGDKPENADH